VKIKVFFIQEYNAINTRMLLLLFTTFLVCIVITQTSDPVVLRMALGANYLVSLCLIYYIVHFSDLSCTMYQSSLKYQPGYHYEPRKDPQYHPIFYDPYTRYESTLDLSAYEHPSPLTDFASQVQPNRLVTPCDHPGAQKIEWVRPNAKEAEYIHRKWVGQNFSDQAPHNPNYNRVVPGFQTQFRNGSKQQMDPLNGSLVRTSLSNPRDGRNPAIYDLLTKRLALSE
jgi:hypothetical protein